MRRVPDARWRTLPRAATFGGLLLVTLVLAFAAIVGAVVLTVVPALFLVARLAPCICRQGWRSRPTSGAGSPGRRWRCSPSQAASPCCGRKPSRLPPSLPECKRCSCGPARRWPTSSSMGPDRGLGSTAGAEPDLEAAGRELPPASRMENPNSTRVHRLPTDLTEKLFLLTDRTSPPRSLKIEHAGHLCSGRPARGEGRADNSHGHPGGGDHDQLERVELAPERAARQGETCHSSQGID